MILCPVPSVILICCASILIRSPRNVEALAHPYPLPYEALQPDGSKVNLRLTRNAHGAFTLHHESSRPVMLDKEGFYVFAEADCSCGKENSRKDRRMFHSRRMRGSRIESNEPQNLSSTVKPCGMKPSSRRLTNHNIFDHGKATSTNKTIDLLDPTDTYKFTEIDFGAFHAVPDDLLGSGSTRNGLKKVSDLPRAGHSRLLVLLVRFANHKTREVPPRSVYQQLFNGETIDPDVNPTGSLRYYYEQQSSGKVELEAHVVDWIDIDIIEKDAAFGIAGLTPQAGSAMANSALEQLDQSGDFDWSQFDLNRDGVLDAVVLIHSGYGAEFAGYDCETNATSADRVWSHKAEVDLQPNFWSNGDYRMGPYVTVSGFYGRCGAKMARLGVIAHECGHLYGLKDLYSSSGYGIGMYDIFSNHWGYDISQYYCGSMSAWTRLRAGWLDLEDIEDEGTYYVMDILKHNMAFRIRKNFPSNKEFLLIENRQQHGWDQKLPIGGGGILVWHVDETSPIFPQRNPGWPGQIDHNGVAWPHNGQHYMLSLLQADGLFELEQGKSYADIGDIWSEGQELNRHTTPNTNAYAGGVIQETGIRLYEISSVGERMSFKFGMDIHISPSPTHQPPLTPSQSPTMPITQSPTSSPSTPPNPLPELQPTSTPTVDPSAR